MSRPRSFDPHAVVDAAMQAFWIGGVTGTSVDDLLQATGLSRSSLYNSFGNREGLMQAAVERYAYEQAAAIQRLFENKSLDQALAALFMDAATKNYDGRGCLLVNAVGELHASQAQGVDAVQEAFARVAAALEGAIRNAAPQRNDSAQLCAAAMAAIAGLRTLQRADVPLVLRQHAAQRLAQALIAS
ncbi:MAG: TetR/AcrR family transcriptional regulator [Betaproteobacteria bacterium]|nr:TetR/AcrR family transcriptional regulator [Betaproteobacteria bacterium]